MSDENKENRIRIDNLSQAEQELSTEEAKDITGGTGKTAAPVRPAPAAGGKGGGNVEFEWKVEEGES